MLGQMTYQNFVDRYRDKAYIGSGGFAKVYKVFDYANNKYVALKIADVRPELKKFTLQNEVQLINRLDVHDHIVSYESCYRFNTGIAGEMDFAILPYYEHGNLEQFLQQQEITLAEKREIIIGILKGIHFLHSNNIIHRDIKAQNILIHRADNQWVPKIADFGLSRNVLSYDSAVSNSSIGVSFEYAAPEQIKNGKIYKNVDLWSVGAIVFRILNGHSPFRLPTDRNSDNSQSQLEISRRIMALEFPESFHGITEPYKAIIAKCLVLDPVKRVREAEELLLLLGEKLISAQEEKTVVINQPAAKVALDQTQLEEEKTVLIKAEPKVQPQPKQDFQYQPRKMFDLPDYENPRKNLTQIFTPPTNVNAEAPVGNPLPKTNGLAVAGGINKFWIYLPLFLITLTATVWVLYAWLNPVVEVPVTTPVEPPVPKVEPATSIPQSFMDCFEQGKNNLEGTFKLIPTNQFLSTFENLNPSCLDNLCNQLSEVKSNPESRNNFYQSAQEGNTCIAPILTTSLTYHHRQVAANNSMAVFYNSGQSDLSIAQKNELNTFLKRYKKKTQDYGLLIIGRASNVGNANVNRKLSKSRAQSIIDFVGQHYIKNLKTEFVYFGADPPQLTKKNADDYGIRNNKYVAIKYGNGDDPTYALRLNQSVLLVMYAKKDDPFDLENNFIKSIE